MIFMEALKDASLPPTASVCQHRRAIDAYQDLCDTVTRNLESLVRKDWLSKFQEAPPLALFRLLSGRSHIAIGHSDPDSFGGGRKRGRESGKAREGDGDKQWGKVRASSKRKSIGSSRGGGGGGGSRAGSKGAQGMKGPAAAPAGAATSSAASVGSVYGHSGSFAAATAAAAAAGGVFQVQKFQPP